ncbi:hypothetical protein [Hydrogenophaga sp.]|uniref:hypothetical protein n=1 Tax=Hydrogenophaga sp. TaxID=1904254 RepID=UPI002FC58A28
MSQSDAFETARQKFFWHRAISLPDGRLVEIALLLREADWRPLDAHWWREKQASIIGADVDGNFLLRHCDGSVRYWDHKAQANLVVSASVRDFALQMREHDRSNLSFKRTPDGAA